MFNNNNYNQYGYGNYGYNNYYYPNQQQVAQPQMQQQIQQPNYLPLTYVNGEDGAKAYIVSPNTTIYLRDSDSNKLFIKTSDNNGKYTIEGYELVKIGENSQKSQNLSERFDPSVFVSKEQLNDLESKFDAKFSKRQSRLDKLQVKKIIEE